MSKTPYNKYNNDSEIIVAQGMVRGRSPSGVLGLTWVRSRALLLRRFAGSSNTRRSQAPLHVRISTRWVGQFPFQNTNNGSHLRRLPKKEMRLTSPFCRKHLIGGVP